MALQTEFVVALAVVSSVFGASMSALMKNEAEKFSALKTSFMVTFYALFFLVPYVGFRIYRSGLFFDGFSLSAAIIAGFFGTGKVWAGVRAFQEIDFSIAQPMKKLAPLFVVAGELVLIGLEPSLLLLSGVFLLVAGSYVLMVDSSNFLSPFRNIGDKGVQLAVLSAFFSAAGALSIRFASGGVPEYAVTYLWYLSNLSGLCFLLWYRESLPSKGLFVNRNFVLQVYLVQFQVFCLCSCMRLRHRLHLLQRFSSLLYFSVFLLEGRFSGRKIRSRDWWVL